MRKRALFVLGAAFAAACSDSTTEPKNDVPPAQTLAWRDVASTATGDLPADRAFYAAATIGDRIYAVESGGGLFEFDPDTQSWSAKPPLPTFRLEAGVTVAQGKLFVLGGQVGEGVGSGAVESYDPGTNAWSQHPPLLQAVAKPGAVSIAGRIFVIGGDGPGGPSKLVQRYDLGTGEWTYGAEMPIRRCALGLGLRKGKIVAVGGIGAGWDNWWFIVSSVQEYDPIGDTWSNLPDLPEARDNITVVSVGDRFFALGGRTPDAEDRASPRVFEYDAPQGTWIEQTPMNHDRYYHAATTLRGAIYIIGGWTDTNAVEVTVERGEFR